MSLSASKRAGFALAALLADDRTLARCQSALGPADAEAIAALLTARPGPRGEWVTALLAEVRPPLTTLPAGLPPRVAGLLAERLPRALGRAALANAPTPRPGFTAGSALMPRLLRIARRLASGARAC